MLRFQKDEPEQDIRLVLDTSKTWCVRRTPRVVFKYITNKYRVVKCRY